MRITWTEGEPGYGWNEKYHLEQLNGSYRWMKKIPGNMQHAPGPDELVRWFESYGVTAVEVCYGNKLEDAANDPSGTTFPDGVWDLKFWRDWAVAMNDEEPAEVTRRILRRIPGFKFAERSPDLT